MKRSIVKNWQRITKEALRYQEMAAFFWHKSTGDDKRLLNWRLDAIETMLNRKDEYNETQAEMALIRMRLTLDDIDLYAKRHPELVADYEKEDNKTEGYRRWLATYIMENPSTELHIIGDSKPMKKWSKMDDKQHVRES